jgi:threonyl-tRNA synthetase
MKDISAIRHSLAHLLAAAVLEKFPDTKLGIGPVIENGFYYDFRFTEAPSDEILPELEKLMRGYIEQHLPFSGREMTPVVAKKQFAEQPFKLDLIKEFSADEKKLTVYATGDLFEDLCRGGHVENTSEINPYAFRLTHLAGAYWRGDEKNAQLTRIYGLAFATKEELDAHLAMLEEAKKRDHKILGPQLDLFTFSPLVGAGLPLWTPKGTMLRDILDSFVWELRRARGYERVDIPHITKKELYETSGHWEKFKDELFQIKTREGHTFVMKPMNCPHHTRIYARKLWSYRELPQRYASTTKCYRDEQSGELAGLSRLRSFTQDDAHVFCRLSQAKEELQKIWEIVHIFYGTFGLKLKLRLSLRDPKHPEKYLGNLDHWAEAEKILKEIASENNTEYFEAPGEAAFYAPKLDFMATDSLGRSWQVATIQFDVSMPHSFDLTCVSEEGKPERIFMIHAAIMGSIERFLAIIIEHYAGAFPVWLSPVQVRVLAISDKFQDYASKVINELKENDIRAELAPSDESLGKRIRKAELDKIPYVLVVGEREMQSREVSVRHYKEGDLKAMPLQQLIERLIREIRERK